MESVQSVARMADRSKTPDASFGSRTRACVRTPLVTKNAEGLIFLSALTVIPGKEEHCSLFLCPISFFLGNLESYDVIRSQNGEQTKLQSKRDRSENFAPPGIEISALGNVELSNGRKKQPFIPLKLEP
ncbi:hypothetical protein AVEN_150730-1 [Araneus ventricosus]|uniref:Uncharacterized protein n=1 Tax=Araneus ventricosus TaxID=182803 RepID=A0A4Y2V829_ARAVE|nr:hypothetical protein AVEN_150730-1 [Araneus ventricosus]